MGGDDLAPGLLLAAPSLGDPNFERTVVLLGHHDAKGAMGWVINGDELASVAELLRSSGLVPERTTLPSTTSFARPARVGGPVAPATGWIVYRPSADPLPGELAVGTDLAVTGDSDALAAVLRGEGPPDFRLVIGYAGWSPGQLEAEIRQGAWLPAAVDAALVLDTAADEQWEQAYQRSVGIAPAAFTSRRGLA
jgi:putative transcriptional regulator